MPTDLKPAIDNAVEIVRKNVAEFGPGHYPCDCTINGYYPVRKAKDDWVAGANQGWTTSFVPGQEWLAYEFTKDPVFKESGLAYADDFARRVHDREDLDTHDLGFLYSLSNVVPYRMFGRPEDREAALAAADALMDRFLEPAGIIQAWGTLSDPDQRGRTIIDSLMNMPLLTWAYQETGDKKYADAVRRHCAQLAKHIVRADNTTFHTFYWDPETGEPLRGATAQGAHDDSCWARGQAWGIYGFAMNYQATGDPELLTASRRCADYFLSHLPKDGVPFWDLIFTDGDDEPRDSSSAAIAACGLQQLAEVETDPERAARYLAAGRKLLDDLIAKYTPAAEHEASNAQILHSVYSKPAGDGVDEGCLWGDYFFMEALMRYENPDWRRYW